VPKQTCMRINGEIKYIPSRTICVKFAGQTLPKYVFFCRNRSFHLFPKLRSALFVIELVIAEANLDAFFVKEMHTILSSLVQVKTKVPLALTAREDTWLLHM